MIRMRAIVGGGSDWEGDGKLGALPTVLVTVTCPPRIVVSRETIARPRPVPLIARRSDPLRLPERLEDHGELFGRNAHAGVDDVEGDLLVARAPDPENDTALVREFTALLIRFVRI